VRVAGCHHTELVRGLGVQVVEQPQDLGGFVHGPGHDAGEHRWAERAEAELERGDHPEVATAAPQPPEQVRVLLLAGHEQLGVRGDDVTGDEVVDRQAELAHQVPDPAAEGEPSHPGMADDAAGRRQPECLALAIEMRAQAPALDADRRCQRIDSCPCHW
jgi:hypothetical protein